MPGNKGGGRPSLEIIEWARLRTPQARTAVEEIVRDKTHPQRLAAAKFLVDLAFRADQSLDDEILASMQFLALLRTEVAQHAGLEVADRVLQSMAARFAVSTGEASAAALAAATLLREE